MEFSFCIDSLVRFCQQSQGSDPLLNKIPSGDNPFTHQDRPCVVLWESLLEVIGIPIGWMDRNDDDIEMMLKD
jgi:hypothetical protein